MSDLAMARTSALTARAVRLSLRNVEGLSTAVMLPVIMMLMFVYLFGGALGPHGHYVQYVVPGVTLVCVGFGAAMTAVSVASDLSGGVIDRFRSMDVPGRTLVNGHVVAGVLRNLLSTAIVLCVAYAIGFRAHAGLSAAVAALGVLIAYTVAISWLAAAIGILARSPETASGVTFLISFLPYASSAFVPVRTMPSWLHGFVAHQPVTVTADSIRALLLGQPVGSAAWHATVWCCAIVAVSVVLAGVLFRRRVRV